MIELAVLGLLKEEPLHGYELRKRLGDTLGLLSVSFGSLYPALSRLERSGAIRALDAAEAPAAGPGRGRPIPSTGSLGGELAAFRARLGEAASRRSRRARKVYEITEAGQALFEQLLTEGGPVDDDRAFGLRLAFARHLPPEARLGMLELRRAHLVERLDRARTTVRAGRERLDRYTRSLVEHGTETTERDISWLDRLIAAERASARRRPATEGRPQ